MINKLGHFSDKIAGYTIEELNLPTSWDYIYKNDKILLRLDQHGPVMAQLEPPAGIVLFRREYMQRYPSWLVWVTSDSFECGGFTNFFRPCPSIPNPAAKPDKYNVEFSATEAVYTVEHEGLHCQTTFMVPPDEPMALMRLKYKNLRDKPISLNVFPAFRGYVNPAQMAPWDKPEWYLKTSLFKHQKLGFLTQLLNMNAQPDNRRYVVLGFSDDNIVGAETYYEKFVGQGNFENPESVFNNSLRLSCEEARQWGVCEDNTAVCFPAVNAVQYKVNLDPNEEWEFSQVLSLLSNGLNGSLPEETKLAHAFSYLDDEIYSQARNELESKAENLIDMRSINTGREDFDRYVNRWLPILQDWVCSLDRGWPSGMRGSRDSANDFTAMIPLRPKWSRKILLELCCCQRSDGWFPRQYSAFGRKGKHDLRRHVDGGCWVVELVYEYLCYTKDWTVLEEKMPWLDKDDENSILEHLIKAIEFFIVPENLGEHGICKIDEGDWNDAVNLAGLRGRGESVMVSCQTVIALTQMLKILEATRRNGSKSQIDMEAVQYAFESAKNHISENLRKHAFNSQGYFNSVFNDDGYWIFSPNDPDGERRVSGPANWYAISSGVAGSERAESILKELDYLKCEQGYRLFYPPFGKKPLKNVGRIATGDQPVGVFENGTAYNQGSHGFLARALAVAGRGDLLHHAIRCLLPFDQEIHPTVDTMTAPYAVTNCWLRVPGYMGRGGLTFLTGSIAMALRAVYDWMFGIKPQIDGLLIDPCLPPDFEDVSVQFRYLDKQVSLNIIRNKDSKSTIKQARINGVEVKDRRKDSFSKRDSVFINDELICNDKNEIIIELD